jgi:hypothetical protein
LQQCGIAEHGQDRRRVLDRGQRRRIIRLAPAQNGGAEAIERGELRFRVAPAHRRDRA